MLHRGFNLTSRELAADLERTKSDYHKPLAPLRSSHMPQNDGGVVLSLSAVFLASRSGRCRQRQGDGRGRDVIELVENEAVAQPDMEGGCGPSSSLPRVLKTPTRRLQSNVQSRCESLHVTLRDYNPLGWRNSMSCTSPSLQTAKRRCLDAVHSSLLTSSRRT